MKRLIGNSQISVSAMGLGCWAIGGAFFYDGKPDGYGEVDDKVSIRAIRSAVDCGVNFFDTADCYGTGHSESVLGEALQGIRDKVVIGTKFGHTYDETTKHVTGSDGSKDYMRWALDQSLRRLRTDYIDLYTLHIGADDAQLAEIIEQLESFKKSGLIRAYCWSTGDAEQVKRFVRVSKGDAVMHTVNLFDHSPEILRECEANNFASIDIFPLAMGMLSGKYKADSIISADEVRGSGHSWVAYFKDGKPVPEYLDKLAAVREILTSGGRTLAQGSLAWIWAKSPVTIPIPGFKTVEQAVENAKAMEFGPLTREQFAEVDSIMGEVSVRG